MCQPPLAWHIADALHVRSMDVLRAARLLLGARPMQRFPPIVAHVFACISLVACGGSSAHVPSDGPATSTPANEPGSSSSPQPTSPLSPEKGSDGGSCASSLLAERGCLDVWLLTCGFPATVKVEDGLDDTECDALCGKNPQGASYQGCAVYPNDDLPGPSVECYTCVE